MKNKYKIITFAALCFIFLSFQNVFAYNITFLGKYLDPTNAKADKSSIKAIDEEYADVYLYFCVNSYAGHGDTSGSNWVNSSSDKETVKTFPNGDKVQYDNSYVNFTGLITFDGDKTLTSTYSAGGSTTDTWKKGQEQGTFSVGYDSYNGQSGEVKIVYPGGEEGTVNLKGGTIVAKNGITADQVLNAFSTSIIGIKADSSTLDLGNATSIGSASAPVSKTKKIGFNISISGGSYSLYKARRSGRANESIEKLSGSALKKVVEFYTQQYGKEKEEIMQAMSDDGVRFSRTCSATNPYADTRIVHNMDTAARAIYGMQAGVTWTSFNLGFKDGDGYDNGDGILNATAANLVVGRSVVNHFDNIIIIPFNPTDEENECKMYIQYKKMEWDKDKEDYKDMEDAKEFAGNDLVKAKNTTSNQYATIEVEDNSASGENFFEIGEVKKANYKITAKSSFELEGKSWSIVKEECRWSFAATFEDAASKLDKSSNVFSKTSFEHDFGKDDDHIILTVRVVYKDEPEEDDGEDTEEEKTLGPLKLKGTLQFVNMALTGDYDFSVVTDWANEDIDTILSATNFNSTFNFFNSTVNESTSNYDYIPSGEYLTPYMTDAYYYIVRALGWKVHDESQELTKTITVSRKYKYTVVWGNKNSDSRQIPTYRFQFTWNHNGSFPLVWRTENKCPFIKDGGSYSNRGGSYSRQTESTTVEGETLYGAYQDHIHIPGQGGCCPGAQMQPREAQSWYTTETKSCDRYTMKTYTVQYGYYGTMGPVVTYTATRVRADQMGYGAGIINAYQDGVDICGHTVYYQANTGRVTQAPYIYHQSLSNGECYQGSTIEGGGQGTVTGMTGYCSYCNSQYTSQQVSAYITGTAKQQSPISCNFPYGQAQGNKASTYYGHTHDNTCFKKIRNGAWVYIDQSIPDSYYTNYVKNYDEDSSDDPSNHPLKTGINATNKVQEGTKTHAKNYNFKYYLKYYEIKNFKMYKISKMEFTDMSGNDEVFEENDTFEVEPSEKYNEVFENSENGIQVPEREFDFKLGATTLDMSGTVSGKKTEISRPQDSKHSGYPESEIVHWDTTLKKVYTYGLYEGSLDGYADHFKNYEKSYEQHNVFLGDNYASSKESQFQALCQESVTNMTCTEAILRVGLTVTIKNMMNDYFKFVKDYEGSESNLAHNKKDLYFTSDDEKHSSSSQTSICMLNRNDLWRGTITYKYTMKDGFKISGTLYNKSVKESGEGTKTKPPKEKTLLGDNAFEQKTLNEDNSHSKDKNYEYKNELVKYIDATNFKGDKDKIYKAYRIDEENSYDSDPKKDKSEKDYVENLKKHVDSSDNKHLTDFYDWSWMSLKIWDDAHNGTRTFNSKIYYEIVENKNLNKETDKKYTNYTENGTLKTAVQDTSQKKEEIGLTDESFKEQSQSLNSCVKVNILSPVSITSADIYTTDLINPTDIEVSIGTDNSNAVSENGGTIYLQKNAQLIIRFKNENERNSAGANLGGDLSPEGVLTKKYIREYWVKFSFDCYYNGKWYEAGQYIRSESLDAFIARTTENYNGSDVVNIDAQNSIEVVAVAINMPFPDSSLSTGNVNRFASGDGVATTKRVLEAGQVDSEKNTLRTGSHISQIISTQSTDDAYHAANKIWYAKGIIRIFGFEITDFKDIQYKHIFRQNEDDEYANSGNYFAGKFEWAYSILNENMGQEVIYHSSNYMIDRTKPTNLGTYGGGYVLPVGPKSQKNGYEYAPKLGYRFSFNVKTSGATTEKVMVSPSYYYIAKDGTGYTEDIDLYYKDSNGVYKKLENYSIYFKPNDGYRFLRFISGDTPTSAEISTLSSNLESKVITDKFVLEKNGFSTIDYSGYVQVWYGEYKLPNSTIVVKKGGSPNNPLTNGYIGVKFGLTCETATGSTADYEKNVEGENTSQWDYEGNFGFMDSGMSANIDYPFEEGTWHIDNSLWQKVKSTVVLYDTDLRADDDFE